MLPFQRYLVGPSCIVKEGILVVVLLGKLSSISDMVNGELTEKYARRPLRVALS